MTEVFIRSFRHRDSFFMAGIIFDTMGVDGFITNYILMMAFITGFLLLGLCWWHGRMISQGKTSVEQILHQNYQQTFIFS